MSLPFKSHPLYALRNGTTIVALLGIILCLPSFGQYDRPLVTLIFLILGASAFFCWLDIFKYALRKIDTPDEHPKWPNVKFMTVDAILAVVLHLAFWAGFCEVSFGYYHPAPTQILEGYGVLMALICSCLHAYAFWKQSMARRVQNWLASLHNAPCARCGYSEPPTHQEQTVVPEQGDRCPSVPPPNTFPYAGPSAPESGPQTAAPARFLTPESTDSAMEEGLLIGSDFGGYGSISTPEPVLEQPAEVVVASSKGKKRAAGGKKEEKKGQSQEEVWVDGIKTNRKQMKTNQQAAMDTWKTLTKSGKANPEH